MNRVLFDPWTTEEVASMTDAFHDLTEDIHATGELGKEEEEEEEENTDWMDAYIQPFLTCELQPSSLDPLCTPSLENDFDGADSDGDFNPGQSHIGPTNSPEHEPSCWISETSSLPSTSGNDDPEDPNHGSPTTAW
jgi:hypothetical protein